MSEEFFNTVEEAHLFVKQQFKKDVPVVSYIDKMYIGVPRQSKPLNIDQYLIELCLKYCRMDILVQMFTTGNHYYIQGYPKLMKSQYFANEVIDQYAYSARYLSNKFLHDREFVLSFIDRSGQCLKFLKREFRDDDEIVSLAIQNDPFAISYASERLRLCPINCFRAVVLNHSVYRFIPKEMWRHTKIAKEIISGHCKKESLETEYITDIIELNKNNADVIISAIYHNVMPYEMLPEYVKIGLETIFNFDGNKCSLSGLRSLYAELFNSYVRYFMSTCIDLLSQPNQYKTRDVNFSFK